jgi:tartrate dehydrogenase/decarboxylase/D-malate dehydrogenase
MMLEHLELNPAAAAIRRSVADVLANNGPRTPDIGGTAKTNDVAAAVVAGIDN